MFLTFIWVLLFLFSLGSNPTGGVSVNAGEIWALIFAVIVDVFFYGYVKRQTWYR